MTWSKKMLNWSERMLTWSEQNVDVVRENIDLVGENVNIAMDTNYVFSYYCKCTKVIKTSLKQYAKQLIVMYG